MNQILFKAIAQNSKQEIYDASFEISWPKNEKLTQQEVQNTVNNAIKQFFEYHPNGKILQQFHNLRG